MYSRHNDSQSLTSAIRTAYEKLMSELNDRLNIDTNLLSFLVCNILHNFTRSF